jgi:hypothetical protein
VKHAPFCIRCVDCGGTTSKVFASKHAGLCKACSSQKNCGPCYREGKGVVFGCTEHPEEIQHTTRRASREEQHARYIDCGYAAWDDR